MKKSAKKILFSVCTAGFLVAATGCEFLQGNLSSQQEELVTEETGIASFSSKTWYYNGVAGEDISSYGIAGSENNTPSTFKINFTKQVALDALAGKMVLSYTDADGYTVTKNISSLSGSFGSDFKSYNLNMDEVVKLLDSVTIPGGTANLEVTVGGFVCAEGEQNGRHLSSIKGNIAVKPFFNSKSVDFSTCWYEHGKNQIKLPVAEAFELTAASSTYKIETSAGNFTVSAKDNEIVLTPEQDIKNTIGSFDFTLYGIKPESNGSSFNQNISVNLVKNAIVMDGIKDDNFSCENAAVYTDGESDQAAFNNSDFKKSCGDLKELSIVNDSQYLYIGVSGSILGNWDDSIVLMINKNGSRTNDATLSDDYAPAQTVSCQKGKPNIYLCHKPGYENSGAGSLSVTVNSSTNSIAANCLATPYGWTNTTNSDFIEYAIPLSDAGLAAGDEIKVIAALSLVWGEGHGICDVLPNAAIQSENDERTQVVFTFANAATYSIK